MVFDQLKMGTLSLTVSNSKIFIDLYLDCKANWKDNVSYQKGCASSEYSMMGIWRKWKYWTQKLIGVPLNWYTDHRFLSGGNDMGGRQSHFSYNHLSCRWPADSF